MVSIARLAAGQVQSVLGGDGGDETFGGYLWQRETGSDAWQSWHQNPELHKYQSEIKAVVADPDADMTRPE